jgi:integrase
LASGEDPSATRKANRIAEATAAAETFDAVASDLLERKRRQGRADQTIAKTEWLLSFASPSLGARPIGKIAPPEIVAVLKAVEARGRHETARRLRSTIGEVFRLAMATGRAVSDPTVALKDATAAPIVRHRAAIVEPEAFGGLLRAIAGYNGTPETRIALELLALTFVRPGELRSAEWAEFDLDAAVWELPAAKMKMRRPHRVALAPATIALLRELQTITGSGRYLFPSIRSPHRCMSENTLNAALRRLGYGTAEMSAHGFRAGASSMLNESGFWNPDAIERQLAHVDEDAVRRAYARSDFWDERVRMMAWWAGRCEELRRGEPAENIVRLRRGRGKVNV